MNIFHWSRMAFQVRADETTTNNNGSFHIVLLYLFSIDATTKLYKYYLVNGVKIGTLQWKIIPQVTLVISDIFIWILVEEVGRRHRICHGTVKHGADISITFNVWCFYIFSICVLIGLESRKKSEFELISKNVTFRYIFTDRFNTIILLMLLALRSGTHL